MHRNVRTTRKQCSINRSKTSNELCISLHHPLPRRSTRSQRQSQRQSHQPSRRRHRNRQKTIPPRRQNQRRSNRNSAAASKRRRRGTRTEQRQHHRDNADTLDDSNEAKQARNKLKLRHPNHFFYFRNHSRTSKKLRKSLIIESIARYRVRKCKRRS